MPGSLGYDHLQHETQPWDSQGFPNNLRLNTFSQKNLMLSGIIGLSLHMAKTAVIWVIPMLHSDPSFFYPRRQLGQAAPLAPPRVALTAFPFFWFWE